MPCGSRKKVRTDNTCTVNYATSKAEAEEAVERNPISGTSRRRVAGRRIAPSGCATHVRSDRQGIGRLDILVNNAGIFFAAKFEELTEEQWDQIMDANLKSQFLCAQAATPLMKRHDRRQNHQPVVARRNSPLAGVYALLRFESRLDHADEMSCPCAGAGDSGEQPGTGNDSISRRAAGRRSHPSAFRFIAPEPARTSPHAVRCILRPQTLSLAR